MLLYDLWKQNKFIKDYFDVHFKKKYMTYICCFYAKNSNPINSINKTNQHHRKYTSLEKNVGAKQCLRDQI